MESIPRVEAIPFIPVALNPWLPKQDEEAPTREKGPRHSHELLHGLITPPEAVRKRLDQERAKYAPAIFTKQEERLLNNWTIDYTFDSLCLEVVYRPTPNGPEVLAVGMEEVIALRKSTPLAEQTNFETFLGYP